ncbi:cystathionine gamma-lyase cys3 [Saitoella coloradoensis]
MTQLKSSQIPTVEPIKVRPDPSYADFSTLAIHAGQAPDPLTGAVIPPLSLTTTFAHSTPGVQVSEYSYARGGNPTRTALVEQICALEKAEWGVVFSSGVAVVNAVTQLVKPGSSCGGRIVCSVDVYGGTRRYLTKVAREVGGYDVSFIDLSGPEEEVTERLLPHLHTGLGMIWLETPSNPLLNIIDITLISSLLTRHSPSTILVVDNTFLSPYLQRPLLLGATIVVHSATKHLGGHSDALLGAAVTNSEELHARLGFLANTLGGVPSPWDTYLVTRGIKTLSLRMERACETASVIARTLYEMGCPVIYPGLAIHPHHALSNTQSRHPGPLLSIDLTVSPCGASSTSASSFPVAAAAAAARLFISNLRIFTLAESLGGVESLVCVPSAMTHASVPEAEVGVGVVRVSVGCEGLEGLVLDLVGGWRGVVKEYPELRGGEGKGGFNGLVPEDNLANGE